MISKKLKDFANKILKKENQIQTIKINTAAFNYYRKHVKHNENISKDQAERKMTRNMMLAMPYKKDSEAKKRSRVWYSYGCLRFAVENGEVIWIENKKPVMKGWYKDYEKYVELNQKLKIEVDN